MATSPRCHLIELPAELRLRIYEYALAPTGSLFLTSNRDYRYQVEPTISPALLATCHQIHHEASSILYEQNSVCIKLDVTDNSFPIISSSRLPQRVLEKLQHICLILDGCGAVGASPSYADVDWTALTALVSLKTLRLTLLAVGLPCHPVWKHEDYFAGVNRYCQDLVREVIERVPAATNIYYGTEEGSIERDIASRLVNAPPISHYPAGEVDEETLAIAVSTLEAEPGSKSGSVAKVFGDSDVERVVSFQRW
ncbi:uncharacterized protein LTR77_005164 [Saxophila tyrrhenica]|uniref:Uncharacterized protein n=1 Tax=Saxophila tyrrhenica TaxID=1690608 RepID=A0AAV9PBM3_9PEZI|nr:hypothetical protein LTR77_005164 [Saxophila tyrrhenica]